jgi:hypothetical protein
LRIDHRIRELQFVVLEGAAEIYQRFDPGVRFMSLVQSHGKMLAARAPNANGKPAQLFCGDEVFRRVIGDVGAFGRVTVKLFGDLPVRQWAGLPTLSSERVGENDRLEPMRYAQGGHFSLLDPEIAIGQQSQPGRPSEMVQRPFGIGEKADPRYVFSVNLNHLPHEFRFLRHPEAAQRAVENVSPHATFELSASALGETGNALVSFQPCSHGGKAAPNEFAFGEERIIEVENQDANHRAAARRKTAAS